MHFNKKYNNELAKAIGIVLLMFPLQSAFAGVSGGPCPGTTLQGTTGVLLNVVLGIKH